MAAVSSPFEVPVTMTPEAAAAVERIGRTEDVVFSPSGDRLVIAGFGSDQVLVLDVVIGTDGGVPSVEITAARVLASGEVKAPHGLAFLDDRTLVVANRSGDALVVELEAAGRGGGGSAELGPSTVIRLDQSHALGAPGSVVTRPIAPDLHEVLICNNDAHTVSRHVVDTRAGVRLVHGEVLLAHGLAIPDGIAFSADTRWIAISNHATSGVLLFEDTPTIGAATPATGVLEGVSYPHGVRFVGDDAFVVVADAGAPYLHVYARGDGDWRGPRAPVRSLRIMDDATFLRGRHNPQEGGPKGIDVDPSNRLLVATSECQPLVFLDLTTVLGMRTARAHRSISQREHGELTRRAVLRELAQLAAVRAESEDLRSTAGECADRLQHAVAREHELTVEVGRLLVQVDELGERLAGVEDQFADAELVARHHQAVADDLAAQLAAVRTSRSWRVTAPIRAITGRLRSRSDDQLHPSPHRAPVRDDAHDGDAEHRGERGGTV